MDSILGDTVRRWRWAALFALFILSLLPFTPSLMGSLSRMELPISSGWPRIAVGLAVWALVLLHTARTHSKGRLLRGGLLTFRGSRWAFRSPLGGPWSGVGSETGERRPEIRVPIGTASRPRGPPSARPLGNNAREKNQQ